MNYSKIPSFIAFSLLVVLLPSSAAARQYPCKQMHRDLDQEIDEAKQLQKQDMQACRQASGENSLECRNLKDVQAQDLRILRDRRRLMLAACPGYVRLGPGSLPSSSTHDF